MSQPDSVGGMNLARRLSPLLAVALLFAGCAPAAAGTSPGSPYAIHSSGIATTAGHTVYVQADYTFADFSIDPTKLTGMLWVPSGYNADSAVITTKFGLGGVSVPEGWTMTLVQVQATRTTVQGRFSKTTNEYTLTVLLAITPKPTAVAGAYHLHASLDYQKASQPLRIDLRVG